MKKILILLLTLITAIFANKYNFTETRYSNALDKNSTLHGKISFNDFGLKISYDNGKTIIYDNGELTISEKGEPVILNARQKAGIIGYLDTIMLLHIGDKLLLDESFEIEKKSPEISYIVPKDSSMKNFIESIELEKRDKKIQEIEIKLKNKDIIIIRIDNEIR
ncbi:hypothetical protein RZR97_10990 [Hydrogenimonas thermophila]|uniref:hypothetical protein n=1 Tax=Hydrogenimonas thermophila TaxID=223786 RepID=UPI002936F467|nr:hypothetical protein [Hydrogenimonas thermophila]WOE69620.1 hypothetical protein RZR91_11000 [Hydrogenimonas thermophila]WOE72134.1 hypothetical protein RZR97_10990 [Hydrogenimonas thermophila]